MGEGSPPGDQQVLPGSVSAHSRSFACSPRSQVRIAMEFLVLASVTLLRFAQLGIEDKEHKYLIASAQRQLLKGLSSQHHAYSWSILPRTQRLLQTRMRAYVVAGLQLN